MGSSKKRIRLCSCLIVLNLIFIWGNSMLPGEISRQISEWVGALLGRLTDIAVNGSEEGHGLLRKLAHFTEFACLGMLLCWRFAMAGKEGKRLGAVTLGCGFAAACVDETIQIFAAERGPGIRDVLIDTCGAAAGMIFLLAGHHFIKRNQRKKHLEETT